MTLLGGIDKWGGEDGFVFISVKTTSMLARAHFILPYVLHVQDGAIFNLRSWHEQGYEVTVRFPMIVEGMPQPDPDEESVTINGGKTYRAQALVIDFKKPEFDRDLRDYFNADPPPELMFRIANDFLSRLRLVTSASFIAAVSGGNDLGNPLSE